MQSAWNQALQFVFVVDLKLKTIHSWKTYEVPSLQYILGEVGEQVMGF